LFSHAARGHFQLKKFYESQPLLGGKISVVDEALAEVMECVCAAGAAALFALQGIEFSGAAFGAKTLMVFPAELQQKFSC
jgi:hypothetical protein